MQGLLEKSIQRIEPLIGQAGDPGYKALAALVVSLPPIQDAYESLLSEALMLLASGQRDECLHQLNLRRGELEPSLGKLAGIIESIVDSDDRLLKMITEYLFTRARLVNEIKMFPEFGLEMLKHSSVDDSLEEVIYRLEYAMTGRQGLYASIMLAFEALQDNPEKE